MIRQTIMAVVLAAVVGTAGTARAQVNHVDSTLHAIRSLFESGSYVAAEVEARRFLERSMLGDSVRAEAEKLIAFSLIAQGKPVMGKEHFLNVLKLQPDFSLDPVLTSPKILTVFQDAQELFRRSSGSVPDSTHAPSVVYSNGVSHRAFLFPGWEQVHTGRTTAGYLFAGAGAAALGSGLIFETLRSSARRDYLAATVPAEIEQKFSKYNKYYKSEIYAFSAFAVIHILSQVDALLNVNSSPVTVASAMSSSGVATLSFLVRF